MQTTVCVTVKGGNTAIFFANFRTSLLQNICKGRPQRLVPHQKPQPVFLSLSHTFFHVENKIPSNTITPSVYDEKYDVMFWFNAPTFLWILAWAPDFLQSNSDSHSLFLQLAQVKWLNFILLCITGSHPSRAPCWNSILSQFILSLRTNVPANFIFYWWKKA